MSILQRIKLNIDGNAITKAMMAAGAANGAVAAQASVTDVVDAFYEQVATEESGRYWWWVNYVLLDPDELIVDGIDDLYRIPFQLSSNGEVTFGDPQKVKIEFRNVEAINKNEVKAAASQAIASVRGSEKVAARYSTRAESRPDEPEGGSVDLNELRSTLGLSADTPDAEVLRVAQERLSAAPADQGGTGGGSDAQEEGGGTTASPATPGAQEEGAPAAPEQPQPPADQQETAQAGAVTIDAQALAELQAQARQGAEARAAQIESEDNAFLQAAMEQGKFPPSRLDHWKALMKADRVGTRETIQALADNVIPIHMRSVNVEANEGQGNQGQPYPESWLPEVAARKRALAAGGERPRVTLEA